MTEWTPTTFENRLLAAYHRAVGGRIYTEVAVPWSGGYKDWPNGYTNRFIDGIRLKEPYYEEAIVPFADHGHEVLRAVEDAEVELIEVKGDLNRPVIGQIIAGKDLFETDYAPATVHGVALCESTDDVLQWVCEQQQIAVKRVDPIEEPKP